MRLSTSNQSMLVPRNWDYSDMNSQHTMLFMVMRSLMLGERFRDGAEPENRDEMWAAGASYWIAASAARTTIVWTLNDDVPEKESWAVGMLMSGSRGTADTNGFGNAAYSEDIISSWRHIYGEEPLLDELCKGDDEESVVAPS